MSDNSRRSDATRRYFEPLNSGAFSVLVARQACEGYFLASRGLIATRPRARLEQDLERLAQKLAADPDNTTVATLLARTVGILAFLDDRHRR